ncbi:hypothetical protein BJV74DRAFT_504885 [Russula compacta]|nr:hypothetical protein BJV74DRAFT_504885 [Russula compacta]
MRGGKIRKEGTRARSPRPRGLAGRLDETKTAFLFLILRIDPRARARAKHKKHEKEHLIEFFFGIVIARRDVTELQNHAHSNPLARLIPAKPRKGLRRILYCSAISPRWRERGGGNPTIKGFRSIASRLAPPPAPYSAFQRSLSSDPDAPGVAASLCPKTSPSTQPPLGFINTTVQSIPFIDQPSTMAAAAATAAPLPPLILPPGSSRRIGTTSGYRTLTR